MITDAIVFACGFGATAAVGWLLGTYFAIKGCHTLLQRKRMQCLRLATHKTMLERTLRLLVRENAQLKDALTRSTGGPQH